MDLLASAYSGKALGQVWSRMKAIWREDAPASELKDVLTRKVNEIAESLPPNSRDAQTFMGFLEQELILDKGKIPYCNQEKSYISYSRSTIISAQQCFS